MTNSKNFRNYEEAMEFRAEKKAEGFHAYVEQFYDFNGAFYSVLYW